MLNKDFWRITIGILCGLPVSVLLIFLTYFNLYSWSAYPALIFGAWGLYNVIIISVLKKNYFKKQYAENESKKYSGYELHWYRCNRIGMILFWFASAIIVVISLIFIICSFF